ncbi:hypothetical protein [Cognatilysobacter bugurensis]|uniref:Uncharacterized protein n=1 Tax=Cognatilysobacter bugurensis TaxID=543356 RepID=A0A918SVZ0_9GAMM|nr:hypothetical protein [Lysobacter bugurensis]GHA73800.1 hypothetical protein GCM10007067_08330 [Lysobacter bugurensis]
MSPSTPRFFRDRDGRVVIGQLPNVPLIGWLVLRVAAWLIPPGHAERLCDAFADGFMFTWAYLELARGDSPFRRVLGAVVLAWFGFKIWSGTAP